MIAPELRPELLDVVPFGQLGAVPSTERMCTCQCLNGLGKGMGIGDPVLALLNLDQHRVSYGSMMSTVLSTISRSSLNSLAGCVGDVAPTDTDRSSPRTVLRVKIRSSAAAHR